MIGAEKQSLFDDYPAAHSMDTTWYAVDENGEIGAFDSGSEGAVPQLEGQEQVVREKGESHFYRPNFYGEYHKVGKHVPEKRVHAYSCEQNVNLGYYIWDRSPKNALTIDDIPEEFRNGRFLTFMKGYRFSSHEPVNPYDYSPCYSCGDVTWFPDAGYITRFPTPGHSAPFPIELFIELHKGSHELNRAFFAQDEDGCLALFRTDYFGAIPCEKRGVNDMDVWKEITGAGAGSFPLPYRLDQLGPPTPIEQIYDLANDGWLADPPWLFLIETTQQPPSSMYEKHSFCTDRGTLALFANDYRHDWFEKCIKAGLVKGAWREWPLHWLEYPFGAAAPRFWGIYHYDASWIHPIPYLRIAAPQDPCRIDQFPAAWRERMNPVLLPGVRFQDAARVQPFECVPCVIDPNEPKIKHFPDHWIDSRLEAMHPCHEFSVKPRDEGYVLAQARKHVAFAESLARP